jgi:type IV secretory pathway ATPase VirB11/archaellum biosynthesis ATPase
VPEKALEPPPSPIVTVTPREAPSLERLLAHALDLAKGGLAPGAAVDEAMKTLAPKQAEPPAATTLREVAGLGLIERLWSDPAVRAIFINGPQSVAIEREGGTLQAAAEVFRDEAQLTELAARLVGRPAGGMADFQLRDGSAGFVIFPPAAPAGPVLTLRRAEPGQATLEGLVSVGMLDRPVAELLRLCVRSRLNVLVSGPAGSGKTALLAALARDLDPVLRVVTVASHRHFRRPASSSPASSSKVELVTSAAASFAMLMAAAARLEPGLLVLDGAAPEDIAALSERLLRGPPGTLAAVRPEVTSAPLARSVDLVVRTDRIEGQLRVVAVEDSKGAAAFALENGKLARGQPAFAATLQARGQGDALAKLFA